MYMYFTVCLNVDQADLVPRRMRYWRVEEHVGIGAFVDIWGGMHVKFVIYLMKACVEEIKWASKKNG